MIKKNLSLLILGLFVLMVFDLFRFGYNYNPLVPASRALEPPDVLETVGKGERIFTIPTQKERWNEVLLTTGWTDIEPFLYFKNGLGANINLVFQRASVVPHSSFQTIRQNLQQEFLPFFFNSIGVKYIISTEKLIEGDVLELASIIKPPKEDLPFYYIYSYKSSLNRFRYASKQFIAKNPTELSEVLNREDFSFEDSIILEQELGEEFEALEKKEIVTLEDEELRSKISTHTDKKAILVVADSYYSVWKAKVNGEEAEIYPVNINQRAVIVPAGENFVEMYYNPEPFYKGVVGSFLSLLLVLVLFFVKNKFY